MIRTTTLLLVAALSFPLFAAQGGPNTYGYIWKDSNEPGGPVYNWVDISTTGILVTGLGDDNVVGPYVMQTDMRYYWYGRKFIWIGSNGYVAFNSGNIASPFPAIPVSGGVNDYIAGMASDLNFLGAGNLGRCYLFDDLDQTIVSYVGVPFWSPTAPTYTGSNSFQIIMNKLDSSITIQYQQQTGLTQNTSLTIGIESVAGSIGLQHSANLYPPTNYAIRFYMPAASSLEVKDATVIWNTDPTSGGIFRPRNGAPFQMISKAGNIGNTPLPNVTFQGQLLNPVGTVVMNETVTIGELVQGLDTIVNFTPFFTPNPAGTYKFVTTVGGIPGELVTANNQRTQEVIVVDTTTATQDLRYHGTQDDGLGLSWNGGNGGVGVYIRPPYYPAYATHTTVRIASNTGAAGYTMKVYDDDGPDGLPGTLLDSVMIAAPQATAGDQVISLTAPITITSGGVYVQWYMLGANINIAVDITPPFSLRTYEVIDGIWAEYRDREAGDFFIGLRLAQVPVYDVGCTGFFGLTNGQQVSSQTAVRVWATNFGNQPLTEFTVNYRFGNGVVSSQNYSGAALNPGQQTLITFNNYFVPGADATDQLCAWTTMANDASATNDTACVSIQTFVGIEELSSIGARLAPNPADQVCRIDGLPSGIWTISIMDAAGRMVLRSSHLLGGGPLDVPVDALLNGAYQLVLTSNEHTFRASLMVRH